MRFLNFATRGIPAFLLLFFLSAGCSRPKSRLIKSPPHYNFSEVLTAKLDLKLQEISGLAWDNRRDEFLAHFDEKGILFVLDKETKQIKTEYPFGTKGDYEDIAIYNGVPYILISDGTIIRINRDSTGKVTGGEKMGQLGITGTNDFETLYADTARRALIMICKNCASDDKKTVSAYAYYPDSTGFVSTPVFQIDAGKVAEMAPHKTSKLQPSAAGIHPVLKKLFIISSAANLFVVADLNGNAEGVYELGNKLFPQPEGLTFKSNGDMYISNEGVNTKSTIHRFVFKP
jgi:SdiA-regulated